MSKKKLSLLLNNFRPSATIHTEARYGSSTDRGLDGFLSRSGNTGIIRVFFRDDVDIVEELWGCNEHAFGVLWADDMAGDSIT